MATSGQDLQLGEAFEGETELVGRKDSRKVML
jgi:hypothetical protein